MLNHYLQQALALYEKTDAILITDKNGFIEYSAMVDNNNFQNAQVTGKHILEVYPTLTEQTSTVMRVLKSGNPILDEEQKLINNKGKFIHILNSTFPIKVNHQIIGIINAAVFLDKASQNVQQNKVRVKRLYNLDDIITINEKLIQIKDKVKRIAATHSNILISGETGTGKEVFAQSIHSHSERAKGPFISQNCAAIPSTLLESLLFGTAKGSYTGAENRKGLFETANHGTLFLDEINSMDITLQSKILKVLEEKKVRKLGENRDIPIDVRIITAMNENPIEAIRTNKLREDLFYRICVVQINLPPLRERKDDIMLLTNYYIQKYNAEMGKGITGISDLVKDLFHQYHWPGNVRELKNIIESSFNVASSNLITMQDIPEFVFHRKFTENPLSPMIQTCSLPELVANYEKNILKTVIKESKNLVEAAKKLNISRQSLQYKLTKYNLFNE
ncbi:sigma 54-interacting transcriptional regulator [Clostridiaceae bacterium 35-E11]